MTIPFKFRVWSFASAIVVLALIIAWVAHLTWIQVNDLREKLSTVQIESYRIADHFQATIQQLDYTLLKYQVQQQREDWTNFLSTSRQLDKWIDQERPTLTTDEEKRILDQINAAYDDYQRAATNRYAGKASARDQPSALVKVKSVEDESNRLLALGYQLAGAHEKSLKVFLDSSQNSLILLRRLIFSSLLLLLICASWLSFIVYRDMIKPLRLKLVESQAIIGRQEKLASLGVLAAGVAHEIRNPLTAIKARLFTLQRMLTRTQTETEDVTIIGKEINRLEKIVRDFLQFARPAEPKKETLSCAALFRELAELLDPELKKKSISLKVGPVSDSVFEGDPHQLKQVLINLVQNAAESIGHSGSITLRSHSENARRQGGPGHWLVMEVIDTGKGITPEVQKRLFDPFFSTKESGTGLGLSIAARIVQKHGGALEFQSEPNRGATFGILLPLAA
jgi:signal transduction histidine kinase